MTEERVTVKLNVELCIGVGNCELLQPDHFTIEEDTGIAELTGDGVMALGSAEEVVDRCPSGALSIQS